MSRLSAMAAEALGLFIDDWGFAVSIVLWLAFVLLCMRGLGVSAWVMAVLLFAGLAAILIESTWRAGRTRRRG